MGNPAGQGSLLVSASPDDPRRAATPRLQLNGITKQYPGTLANDRIEALRC